MGEGLFTIIEGKEFQRRMMSIKKDNFGGSGANIGSKKGLVMVKTGRDRGAGQR